MSDGSDTEDENEQKNEKQKFSPKEGARKSKLSDSDRKSPKGPVSSGSKVEEQKTSRKPQKDSASSGSESEEPNQRSPQKPTTRSDKADSRKVSEAVRSGNDSDSQGSSSSKPTTRAGLLATTKEKYTRMSLDERRGKYFCGKAFVTLADIPTWPAYAKTKNLSCDDEERLFIPNRILNSKVSIYTGDITKLEIDAIVNAANSSLMGGGGVDGAIHRAAGSELKMECATLDGCDTGDAKITLGYRLPAKHVIHTVGPMGEIPKMLKSCYLTSLELVKEHKLASVAFPCVSTGIYGYSNKKAAPVVLKTVRDWLETENNLKSVERIIFCLFLQEDIKIYEKLLPKYFPLD